jgi:hypothetical protein
MKDVFEIASWLNSDELVNLNKIVNSWEPVDFKPNYGRWPGELIAVQHWHTWSDTDELADLLKEKLVAVLGDNLKIVEANYLDLYMPWDIHSEGSRPVKGSAPGYSVVIPLGDYQSRTIVFNECSDEYNDFYKYKDSNPKCILPISTEFWEDNLSHCWDEDREYLSIKYVSQDWRAGDTLFLRRRLFHSSDHFHTRGIKSKRFLQIVTDVA